MGCEIPIMIMTSADHLIVRASYNWRLRIGFSITGSIPERESGPLMRNNQLILIVSFSKFPDSTPDASFSLVRDRIS
jgi:hypothetical protein